MKRVNKVAAGVFLLGQALAGAALAAPVTMNGTNVSYTFDDALLGLFGPASVSGDSLYFTPVDFSAKSVNGDGYALTNETMNIKVSGMNGQSITGLNLAERGDYLLLGGGSSVDVTGQMRVFDVANPMTDATDSIMPSGAMNQTGTPTKNWSASANVDLSSWSNAKTLNVTVDNLLLASTNSSNSAAFIEKKFVGLTGSVTPVPEAQSSAMMLAGLGLVGWQIRRRRSMAK